MNDKAEENISAAAEPAKEEKPAAAENVMPSESVENSAIIKDEATKNEALFDANNLGVLNEVSIVLTIEVGRAQIKIRDLLNLTKGSIIELNKSAGDPVDIYANGKLISTGNIITVNGKYCVRITSIPEKSKLGVEVDAK